MKLNLQPQVLKALTLEILKTPTLSGDYEEHNFSTSGNTLWVKFTDDEYLEWCGVFGLGIKSIYSFVVRIPRKPEFLIIAGGQGYIVNVNTRELVAKTEWDDIQSIIYNEEEDVFVVTDGLRLGTLNLHMNRMIHLGNKKK